MSVSRLRASVPLKFATIVASFTCVAPSTGLAQLATPTPSLTQTVPYTAAFTSGSALPLVLDTIRNARSTLLVADGTLVQTGSFNYTSSAALRNAENVLVVRNAPALAAQYGAEWQKLWDEGIDLRPGY